MCHRSSKSGIRWAGHVALLVELRNAQTFWAKNVKDGVLSLGADGKTVLK